MSTLGLSGPPEQEEGLWKRLLWPDVRNSHDADLLGQQGFWLCEVVAVIFGLVLAFSGHPVLAALLFLFYFCGGIGLRQGSVPAAAMVFIECLLTEIAHRSIGIIPIIVLGILAANLRGAILVARWRRNPPVDGGDVEPMRFNETWRDKFCDQMPRLLWPKLQFAFYALAAVVITIELLGVWVAYFSPHPTAF